MSRFFISFAVRGSRAGTGLLLAVFVAASVCGCAGSFVSRARPANAAEARKLKEIFDGYFEGLLALYPTFATEIGDHRYDDQLEITISEEHRAAARRLFQYGLERAATVNVALLDPQERLYLEVFKRNLRVALDGLRFKPHLMPVRQLASLAVEFPLLGSSGGAHPFRTVTDYENFLKRMETFEIWIDTAIANMRGGLALGIIQARPVIERALPQLRAMIVDNAQKSLLYQPIRRMPGDFSETDRQRLAGAYSEAIERRIVPAYRRLVQFLENDYLDKTRSAPALSDLPDGKPWYDYLVKAQTTTDLTPEAIFDLGMSEMARIKEEMERLRAAQNFTGSLSEFARYLSESAPREAQSRADLVRAYESIQRAIAPAIAKLFGRTPKAPFEIRTIEEFRERAAPSQYWSAAPDGSRPGIFYVNAADIETQPRAASEALFLHEAVPGHHFQLSLQQERKTCRAFSASPTTRRLSRAGRFMPKASAPIWAFIKIHRRISVGSRPGFFARRAWWLTWNFIGSAGAARKQFNF
jgi:uncharacterized protein (DUF885 family)